VEFPVAGRRHENGSRGGGRLRGGREARKDASMAILRMAELAVEAGFPEGVINIVTGGLPRAARWSITLASTWWRLQDPRPRAPRSR